VCKLKKKSSVQCYFLPEQLILQGMQKLTAKSYYLGVFLMKLTIINYWSSSEAPQNVSQLMFPYINLQSSQHLILSFQISTSLWFHIQLIANTYCLWFSEKKNLWWISIWTALPARVPSSFPCHSSRDEVDAWKRTFRLIIIRGDSWEGLNALLWH